MSKGVELIKAERERQIEDEEYDGTHDINQIGNLSLAACCYASPIKLFEKVPYANSIAFEDPFPWLERYDKRYAYGENKKNPSNSIPCPSTYSKKERIDLLVKAGALIAAEIDAILNRSEDTK